MRSKVLILIAAIIVGLLAAYAAVVYINGARARVEAQDQPVEVLVAQQDLPAGISAEQLESEEYVAPASIPRRYVSDGAISSTAAIEGKILTAPLSRGEQLTSARFSLPSEAGLSFAVPADYVAVAMPNSAARGVAGLIRPGDSVVVYGTFEPQGGLEDAITKLILNKARVLAVGSSISAAEGAALQDDAAESGGLTGSTAQDPDEVPGTVTLALTPADAEKLVFANEQGLVWLALLGTGTTQVPSTAGQQYPGILE